MNKIRLKVLQFVLVNSSIFKLSKVQRAFILIVLQKINITGLILVQFLNKTGVENKTDNKLKNLFCLYQ
jgi:hypothetical protein